MNIEDRRLFTMAKDVANNTAKSTSEVVSVDAETNDHAARQTAVVELMTRLNSRLRTSGVISADGEGVMVGTGVGASGSVTTTSSTGNTVGGGS